MFVDLVRESNNFRYVVYNDDNVTSAQIDRLASYFCQFFISQYKFYVKTSRRWVHEFLVDVNVCACEATRKCDPFCSLESLAKYDMVSIHPLIAQNERQIATISRYRFVRRKHCNIVVASTLAKSRPKVRRGVFQHKMEFNSSE